jgi:hypothetical protein
MEPFLSPHIIDVERVDGGIIITFDDGKCAVYSASLLRAIFSKADEFNESDFLND